MFGIFNRIIENKFIKNKNRIIKSANYLIFIHKTLEILKNYNQKQL
ncbi:hypothetical protein RG47T_1685 [Mucilaginibacter polytrichastri]|uniref:Uncharacterized protein n=1 Tax=Mucilaginibacter polytrichastri TaxID=1302689 RepID=A0A1Q5ZWT7_9SPHI|nr:hypothetical protein RG47T_1685 [Mucilaginibacter polytrichastri]